MIRLCLIVSAMLLASTADAQPAPAAPAPTAPGPVAQPTTPESSPSADGPTDASGEPPATPTAQPGDPAPAAPPASTSTGGPPGAVAPRLAPLAPEPPTAPAAGGPPLDARPEPPPGPVTQHVQLAATFDTVVITDPSFELFRDDNAAMMGGLSAGYAFWLDDALSLQPEIGYAGLGASSTGLLGGALARAALEVDALYVGVMARYELWGFLAPHARLSAGVSRTEAQLTFARDATEFRSIAWLPHGTLGAGLTVTTPDGSFRGRILRSIAVGLTLEGGYWLGAPLDVGLDEVDGADGRLAIAQPSLGALSRSGPYVRAAAVLRF